MDSSEIRRMYYVLLVDARDEMRDEAGRGIMGAGGEEYAALARAGALVHEVLSGRQGPEALSKALADFNSLPISSFWTGFIETTGQSVIEKALSMKGDEPGREGMLMGGLGILARAQDGGLPLSEFSIAKIKPLSENGGKTAELAKEIIQHNSLLVPEKRRLPRPRENRGRLAGEKALRGTNG
jgi:hypothetical protein